MVVFSTSEHADAWRRQVQWLANLSRRYTMTSTLVGRVVPQEGFSVNGVHVAAVIRRFTLLPAEAQLTSHRFSHFTAGKLRIAQSGGYPWLLDRASAPVPRVLLKLVGARLQPKDVLQALLYDSTRRNMAWDVLWGRQGRQGHLPPVVCLDDEAWPLPPGERLRGDDQRWVITFASERGARNFARTWHARDFPFPPAAQPRWDLSEGARRASEDGREVRTYAEAMW